MRSTGLGCGCVDGWEGGERGVEVGSLSSLSKYWSGGRMDSRASVLRSEIRMYGVTRASLNMIDERGVCALIVMALVLLLLGRVIIGSHVAWEIVRGENGWSPGTGAMYPIVRWVMDRLSCRGTLVDDKGEIVISCE